MFRQEESTVYLSRLLQRTVGAPNLRRRLFFSATVPGLHLPGSPAGGRRCRLAHAARSQTLGFPRCNDVAGD